METISPYMHMLKDRINLNLVPFTDCGSRLLVYEKDGHFSINLAHRQPGLDAQGRHIQPAPTHPPVVEHFAFTDAQGIPLETRVTTYPHHLVCHTRLGDFVLSFQDTETLLVAPPPTAWGVRFHTHAEKANSDGLGGILSSSSPVQHHVAYTTNARILSNRIQPLRDGGQQVCLSAHSDPEHSLLLQITPRLGLGRYLPAPEEALQAAEKRWNAWFSAVPYVDGPLQAQYYYAWWVLRAGIISPRQLDAPEASSSARLHYLGVSQWDTYFHALAYRHMDPLLAQNQLRSLLDHQQPDGMLPVSGFGNSPKGQDFPAARLPLLAWTAWKLYTTNRDRKFLADLYPALVQWNGWWFEQNDRNGNGLCEYPYPYEAALTLDRPGEITTPLETPDLNTYLYLQQEALEHIAQELGYFEHAQRWNRRAQKTARRMLEVLWDEQAGLFLPHRAGQPLQVRTPFSLFPLLTGQLPQPVSRRLVANLADPRQFWTRYPVPAVALNDPSCDPGQEQPGASRAQVNYLLIEGLTRSGYHGLARELRHRTLEMMSVGQSPADRQPGMNGKHQPQGQTLLPESAAIFIDLAVQDRYTRFKLRSNSVSPVMRRAAL